MEINDIPEVGSVAGRGIAFSGENASSELVTEAAVEPSVDDEPSTPSAVTPSDPPVAQVPADDKPSDEAPVDSQVVRDEPVAEEPAAAPEPKPEKPVDAPTAAQDVRDAALIEAAKVLGISETDPAKIPDAIKAHGERIAQENEQRATQEALTAEQSFSRKVAEEFVTANSQLIDTSVVEVMRAEGWGLDRDPSEPKWWEDKTPLDDGTGRTFAQAAMERFRALKEAELRKPEWESLFQPVLQQRLAEFKSQQARVNDLATKYPDHSREVIQDLKKFDVSPELLENIARLTDSTVKQATATINSALAAANARIAEQEAKISGFDAALEAAKTEALNQAMAKIAAGDRLPMTIGAGGAPTPEQAPSYKPKGYISHNDIPLAGSRR